MSLLDRKAGQDDVTSVNRAMEDVKETLATMTESVPKDSTISQIQASLCPFRQ